MPVAARDTATAALVPWMCDSLPSNHSRLAYVRDLTSFVSHMADVGIHPLDVTGDDIRLYKEALHRAGHRPATISRILSVLRGTYEQFGKKRLVEWDRVGDIQAVNSPRVDKNTTPSLSESEASKLLHAPDTGRLIELRDYAMLFAFFRTACRVSAIARAAVGDLEWSDTELFLVVTEKRGKIERKALLDAAPPLLRFLSEAKLNGQPDWPLFPAFERDRKTPANRHMDRNTILRTVKKYGRRIGLEVDRYDRRGIGIHSLRKTTLTNALEHGARMQQVQALAGHADIRTTQLYYQEKERDAEDAARHIQIR